MSLLLLALIGLGEPSEYTLRGVCVDVDQKPVPHANVVIAEHQNRLKDLVRVRADGEGRFSVRLENVWPARIVVSAHHEVAGFGQALPLGHIYESAGWFPSPNPGFVRIGMRPVRKLRLLVKTPEGRAVGSGTAWFTPMAGAFRLFNEPQLLMGEPQQLRDGVASISIPGDGPRVGLISVKADGFGHQVFAVRQRPDEELVVKLIPVQKVHGWIVAESPETFANMRMFFAARNTSRLWNRIVRGSLCFRRFTLRGCVSVLPIGRRVGVRKMAS